MRRSVTSCLERWSIGFSILLTALSMASWMGMDVYRDTTSRLQGYGNEMFSRCVGTFFSMGSRALVSNHEMHCVGLLMIDTIGLILMSGPVLCVLIRWSNLGKSVFEEVKLFRTNWGNLLRSQMFFQTEFTSFSTILADMQGTFR